MSARVPLLALVFAGLVPLSPAADWPQWLGPNRDGKSPETGLLKDWPKDGPKLLWKQESLETVGTGYGSPAIVGPKLYLVGGDGPKQTAKEFCVCLNVADGTQVWKTPLTSTPGKYADGWGGGPRSTPTVAGDFLYVLGATGDLSCLKASDGSVVWHHNLVKDFGGAIPQWGYSESPLIDGDKLVVTPAGTGGMVALDKATGKTVWKCPDVKGPTGYSSVIPTSVGGVKQYVQQTESAGYGVAADTGKLLWKVGEIGRKVAVIPTPIVKDNFVFYTSGYGAGCELFELKPKGGGTEAVKVYSKNKVVANHHGGVVEVGGYVYGHSDQVGWFCFDYKKGPDEPVWKSKKLDKGSVTYADGRLYCYGEGKGTIALVEASPDDWKEHGRFAIPALSPTRPGQGKVWAHPVVANGKLYLRDYEHLYCYDIAGASAE